MNLRSILYVYLFVNSVNGISSKNNSTSNFTSINYFNSTIHNYDVNRTLRGSNTTGRGVQKDDELAGVGVLIAFAIFFVAASWGCIVRNISDCCCRKR
tara:strand:- start:1086 stop:1379 length:294 start_codon:yes stop_codon:yes gene_type:complete